MFKAEEIPWDKFDMSRNTLDTPHFTVSDLARTHRALVERMRAMATWGGMVPLDWFNTQYSVPDNNALANRVMSFWGGGDDDDQSWWTIWYGCTYRIRAVPKDTPLPNQGVVGHAEERWPAQKGSFEGVIRVG